MSGLVILPIHIGQILPDLSTFLWRPVSMFSQWQDSTAPSKHPGAEPFAPAGQRQGAAPPIRGTFQILEGAAPLTTFFLSEGSPLTFDSYPSSPGGQLHRSSSNSGLPQAVMAGRKSLLSFGFSNNRAQQAASAGNSGLLPMDPAPNSEPGERTCQSCRSCWCMLAKMISAPN